MAWVLNNAIKVIWGTISYSHALIHRAKKFITIIYGVKGHGDENDWAFEIRTQDCNCKIFGPHDFLYRPTFSQMTGQYLSKYYNS